LHDLKIAVELVRKFGIPFGVVINRYGLGNQDVEKFCMEEGIDILMKIPYKREIAEIYSKGTPLVSKKEWKEK